MRSINKPLEFDALIGEGKLVVADFYAHWCGPCQTMEPVLERLCDDNRDRVSVVRIDVDAQPELAARYGVSRIPTILYFQNEEVVNRMTGRHTRSELELKIGIFGDRRN